MNATSIPSTGRYRVITTGSKCWYVQLIADNSLVGLNFKTKKAATAACVRRNLPIELKNLPQPELDVILSGKA